MDTSTAVYKTSADSGCDPSAILRQITTMRNDLVGYLMELEKIHGPAWKNAMGIGGSMISMLGPDALEFVWKNRDGAFSSARGW